MYAGTGLASYQDARIGDVRHGQFAMAVLATQQEGDLGTTAMALVYRIVSYGDVYIFAYPDATRD